MKNRVFKKINFIMFIVFITVMIFNVKVNALDIKVKEARVVETNMSITDPVIKDGVVTNNITFNNSGDYAIFEFTIINNDKEKYTIKDIVDNYKDKNLSIEYDYSKTDINSNKTYTFKVKMTYKNTVKNIESQSIRDLTVSVNMVKEDGKESSIVIVNPKTGDSILKYLILLIIALTGLILKQKKKKAYKLLFILPILFLPFIIFASENYKIDIKFKNIIMKGEFLPYEIKINVPDSDPIIKIVRYGEEIGELPEVEKEGYNFEGWEDRKGNKIDEHTVVTGPIEVNPKLTPIQYTITYDLNGGSASNPSKYTIKDTITLKKPTKKGYNFSGWTGSNGETLQTEVTISNSTGNLNYIAHYSTKDDTAYKVIHRKQTLDLTGYEVSDTDNLEGTTDSVVRPQTKTYTGFISPEEQDLTITPDGEATLIYDYNRIIYSYEVDENTISSIPSGEYPYETEVTVTPKEIPGYTFDKWDDENDDNPRTINIDENTTDLKPIYKANTNTPYKVVHKIQNVDGVTYTDDVENLTGTTGQSVTPGIRIMEHFTKPELQTVTISGDGSTTVTYTYDREKYIFNIEDENVISSISSGEYPYETEITVTPKEIPGYTFDEWNDGNKDNPRTIILDKDISIKPIYKANTNTAYIVNHYKQNITLDGYDLVDTDNLEGTTDTEITPSVKTYTGFTSPTPQTVAISGDGSTVVNYNYTRNVYTFTLNDSEDVISSKPSGEYPYETNISLEAKDKAGYDFEGWSDGTTDNPRTIVITGKTEISPVYTSRTDTVYKVEHYYKKLNNDYEIEEVTLTGETDSKVEAPLKPKTGFITPSIQTVTIKADGSSKVKYYYYRENYSFSIPDRTYIDPSSTVDGSYPYETEITLKAKEREGYTFKYWSNEDTNNPTTFKLSGDITITPNYEANKYTIIFNSNGGTGSMSNEEMIYDQEKSLTKCAFTREGYTFDGWNTKEDGTGTNYDDEESVSNLATSGNKILYATWKANTDTAYKVIHRYQNLDLTTYTEEVENLTGTTDSEVTPEVKGKTGFISPSRVTDTIKSDGSLVITYTYERIKYIFNLINSSDVISSIPSGEYPYETEITIESKEKEGYHFLNWNGDITTNPYTFNLTSDKEFTLNYEPNTYNIIFNSNGGEGTMSNLSMTYDEEKALTKNAFNRTGYTFEKWNTISDGTGTNYNDEVIVKNLVPSGNANLYAIWSANELIFNGDDTISKVYNASSQQVTITGASNGTGTYTYSEVSEKKDNVDTDYITIEGTTITLSPSTPSGIYTYVVKATDTNSGSSKNATYTITITKQKSEEVTNLNVTPEGIVSFTNSSNADGYLISIDGINYTPVVPGEGTTSYNYLDQITGEAGNRTIYVKATNSDGDNYEVSDPVTKEVTVYTLNTSVNNDEYGTISTSSTNVISGVTYTTSETTLTLSDARTITTSKRDITGYTTTFTGWSSNSGTISQDTRMVANYTRTINKYTVTINSNGGTITPTEGWTISGDTATKEYDYNTSISSFPEIYKSGYVLAGYNTKADGTGDNITTESSITNATTIYPQWVVAKAMFASGSIVNAKMKKLAGNSSAAYTSQDTNITSIQKFTTRPDISQMTSDNIVSISNSTYNTPIYMWYDNGIIYWWSEDNTPSLNTDSSYMFNILKGLTNIDVTLFDTSNVTNMEGMFNNCSGLTSLDLGDKFDTSNVTTMLQMFYACSSLTSLDLGDKFNTSNVSIMSEIFFECNSLTSLDLGDKFDTSNVTNMHGMFYFCSSLTSLDLGNKFDTSNVTDMSNMFQFCSGLTSLDVSNFDTSSVINMNAMFYDCSSLTSLNVSSFDTSNVTKMSGMFNGCSSLTSLDLGDKFDTNNVTDMGSMFYNCSSLTSLDVSNFDTSNATFMDAMFAGCSSLTSLDVSSFDTSKVTSMTYMFQFCSGLTSLDVSNFDTSNVINMNAMFCGMTNLTTIYATNSFVTTSVTNSTDMFTVDIKLVGGMGTIYDSSHKDKAYAHIDGGTSNPGYFTDKSTISIRFNANGGEGTMNNQVVQYDVATPLSTNTFTKSGFVFVGWNTKVDGTGTAYADGANIQAKSLTTLYAQWIEAKAMFDTGQNVNVKMKKLAGNSSAKYFSDDTNITTIQKSSTKPDISSMTSDNIVSISNTNYNTPIYMWYDNGIIYWWSEDESPNLNQNSSYMFRSLTGLTNIDVASFDTSKVTDMSYMFSNCRNLTSLDLSNFDTSNVTDMSNMFWSCEALTSLNVTGFNTANVTNMESMFSSCNNVTELNVSSFNTNNVTDMSSLFGGCSNLQSLNLSSFNTSNVTDMRGMFSKCSSLTSLDLSGFNTDKVTDMYYMFNSCSRITALNLSNFGTSKVSNMACMFKDCSSLLNLNISNFDTSSVTGFDGVVSGMDDMFSGCSSLTTLDLSSFDTSKVTRISYMFYNCSSLTSLDLSSFNTSNVKIMYGMFGNCTNLIALDLSSFNTDKVTDINSMFFGCSSITTLDLSSFNTRNVINMSSMFYKCINLETIFVTNTFVTTAVTSSYNMFYNDTKLVGGMGTTFSSSHIDATYAHIDGGTSNPGYFTDKTNINIRFDSNGGTGTMSDQVVQYDEATPLSTNTFTKLGYVFVGWNTKTDGTGTAYADGANIQAKSLTTLYAQWIEAQAMFDTGQNVNVKMKKLAGNSSATYTSEDANITSIQKSSTKPDISSMTSDNIVSISNTTYNAPIYMWYESGTIYWWSEDDTPYLNTNSNGMFYNCSGLTSLDVTNFNTSNVTNMSHMFYGCNSLTSLDVSSFNTSNVTDMSSMFSSSLNLSSLNLGDNFDTSKVRNMSHMFNSSFNLSSLNFGDNFDTSNVTDMSYMFYGCTSLTSLDVSSFDTSNVTNMRCMFDECRRLTSLDLSSFDTSKVTNMSSMFSSSSNLSSLNLGDNFDTSNVTNMDQMFGWCNSLANLDLGYKFDTSNVTDIGGMFTHCSSLITLDLEDKFDTSKVTDMEGLFYGMSNLITIYVPNRFVTTSVTKSNGMFYGDTKLVGGMGTTYSSSHTDVAYAHIDGGTSNPGYFTDKSSINIRFDANGGEGTMSNQTVQYDVATPLNTNTYTRSGYIFNGWNTLPDGTGISFSDGASVQFKSLTTLYAQWNEAQAMFDTGQNVNAKMKKLAGNASATHLKYDSNITSIQKSTTKPDISSMTSDNIVSISNTTYNTPIYMWYDNGNIYWWSEDNNPSLNLNSSYMFNSLTRLTNIDVTSFATNNVTNMSDMFSNCESLISLDLGDKFDTSKVTNMSGMFSCKSLTSLNLGDKFDTSRVTDMSGMFSFFISLTNLDLGDNFDTSNVTNMQYMFSQCKSLTSLDLGNKFDTSNVTNMYNMFYQCSNLTSLDLGDNFDTSNVTNMYNMFASCKSLTSLDLGEKFDTSRVTNMNGMFGSCSSLTSLDLGDNFDTSSVTDMGGMFSHCESLISLDLGDKFDTSNVTTIVSMFRECSSLTSLDLGEKFDTSKVTDMRYMFTWCTNLISLDLGDKFDTGNVTDMSQMFINCSSLITIYSSRSFDTTNIKNSNYMFEYDIKLVGGSGTTFNSSHIDATYARIDGGTSNPGYFTYKAPPTGANITRFINAFKHLNVKTGRIILGVFISIALILNTILAIIKLNKKRKIRKS